MPEQKIDQRTLEEALRETAMRKWQGRRCYATNMSQAGRAIHDLAAKLRFRRTTVSDVTPQAIRSATSDWYAQGASPATINKRLNCLSTMGVSVEGCRAREPKVLKWWLKPEDEAKLVEFATAFDCGPEEAKWYRFTALVRWTTRTGLRLEESLRLAWGDVSLRERTVTVPGLKTATAQATLPLGSDAWEVLSELGGQTVQTSTLQVFGLTYDEARDCWERCRHHLGVQDNPTATLKALRRSAARHLHVTKGMPLDMVRQYLRHEDIETTMGYLRLTGGYGTEEMRKWL